AGVGGFAMEAESQRDGIMTSVGSAADIDGDGLDDVIIGAPSQQTGVGRVYVVFGKTSTTAVHLADVAGGAGGLVSDGEPVGQQLRLKVGGAGGVNGDGIPDLAIGGIGFHDGFAAAPRLYVVFGRRGGAGPVFSASDLANGVGGFVIDETQPINISVLGGVGD